MSVWSSVGPKVLRRLNAVWKSPRRRRARREFDKVALPPGEIAIDCGANVGEITRQLARNGATVYAFEPNPVAFELLATRFKETHNVYCLPLAVSNRSGSARLFLHRKYERDPLGHSAGSSLLASKHNLDAARAIEVPTVHLAAFVESLPRRVRLLKIDVEGLETMLINDLIDRGALERIDHVFCETHEFKVPGLARQCRLLRRRLRRLGIVHTNLDWV